MRDTRKIHAPIHSTVNGHMNSAKSSVAFVVSCFPKSPKMDTLKINFAEIVILILFLIKWMILNYVSLCVLERRVELSCYFKQFIYNNI